MLLRGAARPSFLGAKSGVADDGFGEGNKGKSGEGTEGRNGCAGTVVTRRRSVVEKRVEWWRGG